MCSCSTRHLLVRLTCSKNFKMWKTNGARILLILEVMLAAAQSAKANTEIINFIRPATCSSMVQPSKEAVSAVLRPSIRPVLLAPGSAKSPTEMSLELDFDGNPSNSRDRSSDCARWIRRLCMDRYTVRVVTAADTPVDVSLSLGSFHSVPTADLSIPCPKARLKISLDNRRYSRIPAPTRSSVAEDKPGRTSLSKLFAATAESYLGSLVAGVYPTTEPAIPVHVTFEPLLFGIVPLGLVQGGTAIALMIAVVIGLLLQRQAWRFIDSFVTHQQTATKDGQGT
ncbi:unnamed protein product [Jaminaea pallidilutea]